MWSHCDLVEKMGNFAIIGIVLEKSQTVFIQGKKVACGLIEDETGKITLNLFEKQINQVEVGQRVIVTGAFAVTNGSFLEISSWRILSLNNTSFFCG